MTKQEKKHLQQGLAVVLALALIYAGESFWVNHRQDARTQQLQKVQEDALLLSLKPEEIRQITFGIESQVELEQTEAGWGSPADPLFTADPAAVSRMIKDLTELTASRRLGEVSDPAAYGLASPQNEITVRMKDGSSHQILVGNHSDSSRELYIRVDGSDEVSLTKALLDAHFSGDLNSLAAYEAFPEILPETIREISVEKKKGSFILKTPGDDNCTVAGIPGEERRADVGLAGKVQSDLANCTWLSNLEYHCMDLSVYGLAEPSAKIGITCETSEGEETVSLLLGDRDASGNYYVMQGESSQVHTVRGEYLEGLAEAEAQSFWSRNYSFVSIGDLAYLEVTIDQETHTLRRVSENGLQDGNHLTWFVDDREVSGEAFKKFYYDCVSVTAQERLPQVPEDPGTPELTLRYFLTDGTEKQLDYYPTDQNFDTVVYDGGESAASVNRLYVNAMQDSGRALLQEEKDR